MPKIDDEYFEWLVDLVCRDRFSKQISFRELLAHLHDTEFIYVNRMDRNRAQDGIDLRYRFAYDKNYSDRVVDDLPEECSVLEMMVALSLRCEEYIMSDPGIGDRTSQWFWEMIASLGLGSFYGNRYDAEAVEHIVRRFLNRDYDPDGCGGLFSVRNCEVDMRDIEIWHQLLTYLNSIV